MDIIKLSRKFNIIWMIVDGVVALWPSGLWCMHFLHHEGMLLAPEWPSTAVIVNGGWSVLSVGSDNMPIPTPPTNAISTLIIFITSKISLDQIKSNGQWWRFTHIPFCFLFYFHFFPLSNFNSYLSLKNIRCVH